MKPTRVVEVERDTYLFGPTFARGGALLLTTARAGDKHVLFGWDTSTWTRVWGSDMGAPAGIVVGHDETWVATSSAERISIWDTSTGKGRASIVAPLYARAALPKNRLAALLDTPLHRPDGTTVDEGTRLVVFDAEVGEILWHLALHARVVDVVANADGTRAITIHARGESSGLASWDLSERRRLATIASSGGLVAFRPSSNEVVLAGSFEDAFRPVVFDADSGERLAVLEGARKLAECHASAISPDGRRLVTVHGDQPDNHWFRDQRLVLWDLERRRHLRTLGIDWQGWPTTVIFTPDGRVLGVATDRGLAIWELDVLAGV